MTRESRDPLSVLRESCRLISIGGLAKEASQLREAIAQVEALARALQLLRCEVRDYFGAPTESGVTWPIYFSAAMKVSSDALVPFTPTDSEGGGNG